MFLSRKESLFKSILLRGNLVQQQTFEARNLFDAVQLIRLETTPHHQKRVFEHLFLGNGWL